MAYLDRITPIQRVNPQPARHPIRLWFKKYLWRWQRCRARDSMSYFEWQIKLDEQHLENERDTYEYWKRKERAEGLPDYDDRDRTWRLELYIYGGIVVFALLWMAVYLGLRPYGLLP